MSFVKVNIILLIGMFISFTIYFGNRYLKSPDWQFWVFTLALGLFAATGYFKSWPLFPYLLSSSLGCLTISCFAIFIKLGSCSNINTDGKDHCYVEKSNLIHQDNSEGVNIGLANTGIYALTDKQLNRHCLILGASGVGKTVTIGNFIESAILRNIPLIFVDGKGDSDLYRAVEDFTKKVGTDFRGLSGSDANSWSYNPLTTGDFTSKKDRIVSLRDWSEDHYRILAEGYLQTAFKVLEQAEIKIDMVNLADHLEFEQLVLMARQSDNEKLMNEVVRREAAAKQVSSLIAEIDNLAGSAAGQLLDTMSEKPCIQLNDVISEGGVAMFSINKLQFPQFGGTLGKLVINDVKALAGDLIKQGACQPFYLILDEFSGFAGDQVTNLINMGRSAGAHVILGSQTLSDMDQVSRSFTGQVLGSVSSFIVHSLNNPDDAERMASVFGTRQSNQITHQIGRDGTTGTGSLRSTRSYLIHPDDIKNLGVGQAYIYSKTNNSSPSLVQIRRSEIG